MRLPYETEMHDKFCNRFDNTTRTKHKLKIESSLCKKKKHDAGKTEDKTVYGKNPE